MPWVTALETSLSKTMLLEITPVVLLLYLVVSVENVKRKLARVIERCPKFTEGEKELLNEADLNSVQLRGCDILEAYAKKANIDAGIAKNHSPGKSLTDDN